MILLVEYDRGTGKLVSSSEFDDSQRREAEALRLNTELELHRKGIDREVILLEASSKEALQRTHQRYFSNLVDILKSAAQQNR